MAVILVEVICLPTNEVWYGVRTETLERFITRCRSPFHFADLFNRRLQEYGVDQFKFRVIGTYMNQTPAIREANELILKAMEHNRSMNHRMLSPSNLRNAKI